MKTKIVYCLVSDNEDYYYEQLLISLYSLREYNPDAIVEVVVDYVTYATLVDNRSSIKQFSDSIIQVEVPEQLSKKQRSRFIKTNLRKLISGDYLFIDTDTVILDSLEDIDNCSYEIGAVLDNHHGIIIEDQLKYLPVGHEWHSLRGSKHFNSGVFYVKDTPNTHAFYHAWNQYWLEGSKIGFLFDQLPLRKVVLEFSNVNIGELDGIWNCQAFRADSKPYWKKTKIFHCQGVASNTCFPIATTSIYEKTKRLGFVPSEIKSLIDGDKANVLKKRVIIEGRDLEFYESPMRDVFFNHRRFFNILVVVSRIYSIIRRTIWKAKQKVKRLFLKFK